MNLRGFIKYGGKTRNKTVMLAKVGGIANNNKVVQLAGLYWDLLVGTYYLKEETYLNIIKGLTYSEIQVITQTKSIHTVIYRDKQRLKQDLGVDILTYIEEGNYNTKEIDGYMIILEQLLSEQDMRDQTNLLNKLNINFNQFTYHKDLEMDDMDYMQLVDRLSILSKSYTEMVVREMDSPEIMGYIKYLLGTKDHYLTEQDKQRKLVLMQAWWLNHEE